MNGHRRNEKVRKKSVSLLSTEWRFGLPPVRPKLRTQAGVVSLVVAVCVGVGLALRAIVGEAVAYSSACRSQSLGT